MRARIYLYVCVCIRVCVYVKFGRKVCHRPGWTCLSSSASKYEWQATDLSLADVNQEGLFRKCGHLGRQKALREKVSRGNDLECDLRAGVFTAHDCANVLKLFLGEMQDPLLTERHYFAHCQVAGSSFFLQNFSVFQVTTWKTDSVFGPWPWPLLTVAQKEEIIKYSCIVEMWAYSIGSDNNINLHKCSNKAVLYC